jgi:hypothetical protein
MCSRLLLAVLAFVPLFAYAEQYDFTQYGPKKSIAANRKSSTKYPSALSIKAFAVASPERFILTLFDDQETSNVELQTKKGKKKESSKSKKKHDKNTLEPASAARSLNERIRHQKVLVGLMGGYSLDPQSALELTIPISVRSPFIVMPYLSYKWSTPPKAGKMSFYGKGGLILPWGYYSDDATVSTVGESDFGSDQDTSSIRTTSHSSSKDTKRKKRSERERGEKADSIKTRHSEKSKQSKSQGLLKGFSDNVKAPFSSLNSNQAKEDAAKKKNSQHKVAPSKPIVKSTDSKTKHDTESEQSSLKYDIGIIANVGMLYPLHSNVFIEVSANAIYPLTGSTPSSATLPFGLIGWIQIGLHFKLG